MKTHLFIALFAILLFLPWLGLKQIHSRGEAREALVAQSMELSGNYILPSSYSDLMPSKPPMLHWMINLAAKVTGKLDEFAIRLPVALMSIFFAIYFSFFLKKMDEKYFWLPPLLLLTSVQWFRHSSTARVDMLLSVGSVVALLELFKWREFKRCAGIPVGAIAGLVMGVYAKGPVGLVLPVGIFAIFCVIERDAYWVIIKRCFVTGIITLAISVIWYVLAYQSAGHSFLEKVWYENAQRLAGTIADEPHKNSILYLYASVLWSLLPWSLFFIWPVVQWIKNPARLNTVRQSITSVWNQSGFSRFLMIWIMVFVIFYSIPEGKRDVYLLPIMPAIAVLLGRYLQSIDKAHIRILMIPFHVVLWGTLLCLIGMVIVGGTGIPWLPLLSTSSVYIVNSLFIYAGAYPIKVLLLFFSVLFVAVKLHVYRKDSINMLPILKAVLRYAMVLVVIQAFFSVAIGNALSYKPVAEQSQKVLMNESSSKEEVLYSYNDAFYGLSFYLKRKFAEIDDEQNTGIPNGKVFLFEKNQLSLQKDLKPGQCTRELMRSTVPMVAPKRFVLLIEVFDCGT